ncbi:MULTISPECIES: hypothetical protein [unclassified Bradyrhizobium]|uniref:hypothetical protein n=1 Tax=Bradyrhizobium sp. USDA 4541 TaxID=2817704 RepID=UPI0020A4C2C0|nr:hypothetical protein [Bradyrhizobium sp. USDA 4541]MCP1854231.1 hypothetical protein [Bradyrhizobium sp. USDA 4541]
MRIVKARKDRIEPAALGFGEKMDFAVEARRTATRKGNDLARRDLITQVVTARGRRLAMRYAVAKPWAGIVPGAMGVPLAAMRTVRHDQGAVPLPRHTDHELQAKSGHKTASMVHHYTKAARKKMLADSGAEKSKARRAAEKAKAASAAGGASIRIVKGR